MTKTTMTRARMRSAGVFAGPFSFIIAAPIVVLAPFFFAGCSPTLEAAFQETFETSCDGVPCGWEQISGPEGDARWIETLVGDHGLELRGDGTSVRRVLDVSDATEGSADYVVARANARCASGANLSIRVTFEDLSEAGTAITFGGELLPEDSWRALGETALTTSDELLPPWRLGQVLGVAIRQNGEGPCQIDYLAIRTSTLYE